MIDERRQPCGLDAHRPHGIVAQRSGELLAKRFVIRGEPRAARRGAAEGEGAWSSGVSALQRDGAGPLGESGEARRAADLGERILRRLSRRAPILQPFGRPIGALIGMAGVAGVGRAELRARRRTRDAEGVIAPDMNLHIGPLRHMAGDASSGRRALGVTMMPRLIEHRLRMTLGAQSIALGAQRGAMRLVAIDAGHARAMHAALLEGAPFEDLVLDLAIGEIEPRLQQLRHETRREKPRRGALEAIGRRRE